MDVPSFVFQLLQEEICDIQRKLLERVAERYMIPPEDLIDEFVNGKGVQILPEKKEKVVICKKQKGRAVPEDEHRCYARVWNRGKGGQCTRKKVLGSEYCYQHVEERRHGNMGEVAPAKIFRNKTKVIYK